MTRTLRPRREYGMVNKLDCVVLSIQMIQVDFLELLIYIPILKRARVSMAPRSATGGHTERCGAGLLGADSTARDDGTFNSKHKTETGMLRALVFLCVLLSLRGVVWRPRQFTIWV